MRSASGSDPGSRSSVSAMPSARSRACRRAASVLLPAPSIPSIVISRPCATARPYTPRSPGARSLGRRGAPARRRCGGGSIASDRRPLYACAMELTGIERRDQAGTLLRAALAGGQVAHAYLFHGPTGAGKSAAARAFAAALLADGDQQAHARALAGAHADLTWVEPSRAAGLTPLEGRRRVFVIAGAERMGEEAANRLLKTLEEPPPAMHLILLASSLERVIATVRSRCQAVRFAPAPAPEVAARLASEGLAEGEAALACAQLADCDLALARELAQPAGCALRDAVSALAEGASEDMGGTPWQALLSDARERASLALAELKERQAQELESAARSERAKLVRAHADAQRRLERRVRTERLDLALTLLERCLRDAWALALSAGAILYAPDRAAAHQALADAWGSPQRQGAARLARAIEAVAQTRLQLSRNVSEELACEALYYRLCALARGAQAPMSLQAGRGWA